MTRPLVDYHREKYGLVALSGHLTGNEDWDEVLLSVPVRSLAPGGEREGIVPPIIDAEADRTDERYRYNFYTDIGGRIDLVAWGKGGTLVVEGKGTSAKPQAAIEQLIGRMLLWMDPSRTDLAYAILVPDQPEWERVITAARHPALGDLRVYLANPVGDIRRIEFGQQSHG